MQLDPTLDPSCLPLFLVTSSLVWSVDGHFLALCAAKSLRTTRLLAPPAMRRTRRLLVPPALTFAQTHPWAPAIFIDEFNTDAFKG